MSTFEEAGMSGEEFAKRTGANGAAGPPAGESFSDADLLIAELPEPIMVIPVLIAEGLTLLAGRPKSGKTTFMMCLADAKARGGCALGCINVDQSDVLFLALEDNRRRLRKRRRMMLDGQQLAPAAGLTFYVEWPKLDQGGLDRLESMLKGNPKLKLVVIDTWKKVCPRRQPKEDAYELEVHWAGTLQKLAATYGVAIVIIHHTRKGPESEDFIDDVLGSTGLVGAADSIIRFKRKRNTADAEVAITGRDVEEAEKALSGDQTTGIWTMIGDAAEIRKSKQREEVIDALKDGSIRTVKELSDELGHRYDAMRMLRVRMKRDGLLSKVAKGYCLAEQRSFS
jgi:RecA-family ATPase